MIPALGLHNVSNALAAIAVAYDQGLTLDDIRCGLLTYEGLLCASRFMSWINHSDR